MREPEPMTQTMKISDVKNKLSSLVKDSDLSRYIL